MFTFDVTTEGLVPGNVPKRVIERANKPAFVEAGKLWHQRFRRQHFGADASARYGYAPRKPLYLKNKRRAVGHIRPLVFSGQSEQLSRIRDVRATSKRGRIVLHTPGLNRKHPASQVNMREEMTTVIASEGQAMAERFVAKKVSEMSRYTRRKKTRIR